MGSDFNGVKQCPIHLITAIVAAAVCSEIDIIRSLLLGIGFWPQHQPTKLRTANRGGFACRLALNAVKPNIFE